MVATTTATMAAAVAVAVVAQDMTRLEPQVHFYILHLYTIQGDEGVGACD